jgi:hypothetical protein
MLSLAAAADNDNRQAKPGIWLNLQRPLSFAKILSFANAWRNFNECQ